MKAQCDKCKEIVALVFRTEAGGIRVTCPSCDAVYSVAAADADADADADAAATDAATVTAAATATATATDPPTGSCPKCGEPHSKPSSSCRRCGLSVAKWPTWNALDAGDSAIVLGDVRAAASLFDRCLASWEDSSRHDAFIAHCASAGAWAYAAACYRRQTADVARRPLAQARLADIRVRAEKALAIMPRDADAKPAKNSNPTRTLVILVIVVVLLVAGIFLITGRMAPHGR